MTPLNWFLYNVKNIKWHLCSGESNYVYYFYFLSLNCRSLKLWMVLRLYGLQNLQRYIRNHIKLAELFEELVAADSRFEVIHLFVSFVIFILSVFYCKTSRISGLIHVVRTVLASENDAIDIVTLLIGRIKITLVFLFINFSAGVIHFFFFS